MASLRFERRLWSRSIQHIAGIDEVGRGSLAGPVVAAAVILPIECDLPGVDDSKRLSPAARARCYDLIVMRALAYGIGRIEAHEIDRVNIVKATCRAMEQAVSLLALQPQHLLIDGRQPIQTQIPQTCIVNGDRLSLSVAAASIIAKVTRDRWMEGYELSYPAFHFGAHKGYGTTRHMAELMEHGCTPLHRRSFSPCNIIPDSDGSIGRWPDRGGRRGPPLRRPH
ncbi:MAG: ribonuclease HII [Deltaproteobacteria bacterium]|nr:ribonuclease HII [Deltaproteobacteria bacterium]